MNDLTRCKSGSHRWVEILNLDNGNPGGGKVVRWCSVCGSIVVDHDLDNRTQPGYYVRMTTPDISKQ